jgi:hypothetical protein
LLEFNLHEIEVGSRHYILLPKLNRSQMQMLGNTLKSKGFTIYGASTLTAKGNDQVLHINPQGLCWSASDPSDLVVPALPKIMRAPKVIVPLEELKSLYFTLRPSESVFIVRFEPRMEKGPLWKALRATDQCGLAPDELAVLLFLLKSAGGECEVLTDFPTRMGRRRLIGGKLYFDSHLAISEVRSTLRSVEARSSRNSYLPRGMILRLSKYKSPSELRFSELFESLGEWCFLTPASAKGLIG